MIRYNKNSFLITKKLPNYNFLKILYGMDMLNAASVFYWSAFCY